MAKSKPKSKSSDTRTAATITPAASPAGGDGAPAIDSGISAGDRKKIAEGLSRFLADTFNPSPS